MSKIKSTNKPAAEAHYEEGREPQACRHEASESRPSSPPASSPRRNSILEAVAKANPRREGTFGFKSIEVIRKSPGITYPDFLAAGGRKRDLLWDVQRSRVVAK